MHQPAEALSGMLIVLSVGILILALKTMIFWNRWPRKRHPVEAAMNLLGWAIVYLVTTGLLFGFVSGGLGLFWLFGIPCMAIFVRFQNLRANQQGFLWMMALAAEKQIPLIPAIEAYAYETGGRFGDRVAEFAELLKSGVVLPDALRWVPELMPADRYPLICSAYASGVLAKGLREAATGRNFQQSLLGSLSAKMLYIFAMILFGFSILTFIMIKIIPSFEKIFKDFHAHLPTITRSLIGASHVALLLWPILTLMALVFFFLFTYTLFKYLGIPVFELPGMGRLMRRKHTAEILENLAMAVENHRAIDSSLQTLVQCYPNKSIQKKLSQVLSEVHAGAAWSESLFQHKLISRSDLAVMQAAGRAGNLPWAMREMADSNRRRLAYRMNVLVQLLFPPVVLCFGAVVLFVVVAIFMPLIVLIQQLS